MTTNKIALMILAHESTTDRYEKLLLCLRGLGNLHTYGMAQVDVWFFTDRPYFHAIEHAYFNEGVTLHQVFLNNSMALADRHNAALQIIIESGNKYDYFMQLGSDDIITHEGYVTALMWMRQGCQWGAFIKVAIVRPDMKKMVYHGGLGNMGAGRFIAWHLIKKTLEVRPIWSPGKIKGMDGSSEKNIGVVTHAICYPMNTYLPCVYDLKSDDNLHEYDKFAKAGGAERDFNIDNILA
jgi:hypothetical protein